LKCVGAISDIAKYEKLGVPITNRALHNKNGSFGYVRAEPIVPEIQVCLEFLSRPTVDWRGRVFQCNRLDTKDEGLIGDLNYQSLDEIWNGPIRQGMLKAHLDGERGKANNLCSGCRYWGIPTPAG
jgi:radical SAM protein with 4Fe4S-binding SPASM domain